MFENVQLIKIHQAAGLGAHHFNGFVKQGKDFPFMTQLEVIPGTVFSAVKIKGAIRERAAYLNFIFIVQVGILGLLEIKLGLAFHQKQDAAVNIFVDVRADMILEQVLVHVLEEAGLVSLFRELLEQHFIAVILNKFQ